MFRSLILSFLSFNLLNLAYGQSPRDYANKVIENFVARSSFEFVEKEIDPLQNGVLVVSPKEATKYLIETIITIPDGRYFIALAANEGILHAYLNDQVFVKEVSRTNGIPQKRGQNNYKAEFKSDALTFGGDYQLKIDYSPTTKNSSVFIWVIDERGNTISNVMFKNDWDDLEPGSYRYLTENFEAPTYEDWNYPTPLKSNQLVNSEND